VQGALQSPRVPILRRPSPSSPRLRLPPRLVPLEHCSLPGTRGIFRAPRTGLPWPLRELWREAVPLGAALRRVAAAPPRDAPRAPPAAPRPRPPRRSAALPTPPCPPRGGPAGLGAAKGGRRGQEQGTQHGIATRAPRKFGPWGAEGPYLVRSMSRDNGPGQCLGTRAQVCRADSGAGSPESALEPMEHRETTQRDAPAIASLADGVRSSRARCALLHIPHHSQGGAEEHGDDGRLRLKGRGEGASKGSSQECRSEGQGGTQGCMPSSVPSSSLQHSCAQTEGP